MSFVLCKCGKVTNNHINSSEVCSYCNSSNWINSDDINIEAIYYKEQVKELSSSALRLAYENEKLKEALKEKEQ